MTLEELAARCEAAEGPDRELDCLIACELDRDGYSKPYQNEATEDWFCVLPDSNGLTLDFKRAPRYTASIDAAMTLVTEGWETAIYCAPLGSGLQTNVQMETEAMRRRQAFFPIDGTAATPALALCAAALRARQEADHG